MVIKTGKIGKRLVSSKVWKNSSKEHSTKNTTNKCLLQPSDMHTNYLKYTSMSQKALSLHVPPGLQIQHLYEVRTQLDQNLLRTYNLRLDSSHHSPDTGSFGAGQITTLHILHGYKDVSPLRGFFGLDTFAYSGCNYPHHYQDSHDSQAKSSSKTNHYKTNKQTETTQPERSTTIYHYAW